MSAPAQLRVVNQEKNIEASRTWQALGPDGITREEQRAQRPRGTAIAHSGTRSGGGAEQGQENMVQSGALWTRHDEGAGWVGRVVSLGAHGTQVFSEYDTGLDQNELISGFDVDPVTPVWQHNLPMEGQNSVVDSAVSSNVHVVLRQTPQPGNASLRTATVQRHSSSSLSPDWTWSFPNATAAQAKVAITDDGQRIVAVSLYHATLKLQIAIFEGAGGTPTWYGEIPFGTALRGFELSGDGSTLYVTSQTTAFVFNVNTHTTNVAVMLPGSFEAHTISGDGRVFAFGYFNGYDIYERTQSGGYTKTFTRTLPGSCVASRVELSSDGSTLAAGFSYYDTNLKVRVEALDVATKTVTMTDEMIGTGALQNVCSDIAISSDGQRFAVGLWGDAGNACPELRFYRRAQNAPVATYNLPGSVFDVDMSADGKRVAVGAKAVHANTFAGGGSIALYSFEPIDLRAIGAPRLGDTVSFELYGPPNRPAHLLFAQAQATTPRVLQGVGTLHLARAGTQLLPLDATDGTGFTATTFSIPNVPTLIGRSFWFQGFFSEPARLTNDWVRLTVVP